MMHKFSFLMPYLKNSIVCDTKSVLEYIIYYYVSELQYQKVLLQKVKKSIPIIFLDDALDNFFTNLSDLVSHLQMKRFWRDRNKSKNF